jgi:hypothetical protein
VLQHRYDSSLGVVKGKIFESPNPDYMRKFSGYPGKSTTIAMEYFHQILTHYQRVRHTDMRRVTAIAIVLAAREVVARPDVRPVLELLHTDLDDDYFDNWIAAKELVDHLIAIDVIEGFMRKAPSDYRRPNFRKVSEVARRIRARFLESRALRNESQKRQLRMQIVAACLQRAMAQFRIASEMRKICDILGIAYDEDAIYAEGKVSNFARRTDFTRKGQLKDARKQEQKAKAKAERETALLTDGLASL